MDVNGEPADLNQELVSNPDLMRWVNGSLNFQSFIMLHTDCQRSKVLFSPDFQGVVQDAYFFEYCIIFRWQVCGLLSLF